MKIYRSENNFSKIRFSALLILLTGISTGCDWFSSSHSGADADATDTDGPTVTVTTPADGDTDVSYNRSLTAGFSEEMDVLTIDTLTFTLVSTDSIAVAGTVELDATNRIATFSPISDLDVNTVYTATVTTGAEGIDSGALDEDYVWQFTTGNSDDTTTPTVTETNPEDDDETVALNATIRATFSEAMDALELTSESYSVTGPDSETVTGTVSYDAVTDIASFNPDSNLDSETTYTATIASGASDLAGNALEEDYVWTFTTGTAEAQTVIQDEVVLGAASGFAILASAAITDIPTSNITGDVGLTPDSGSNISGFSDPANCPEVTGTIYAVDVAGPACSVMDPSLLSDAKEDAAIAFEDARASARGTPQAISGNLNGLTLYPGLYESGSSIEISAGGFLYLDAQGDENAVFIIRSETSITTESTSEVVLTKGAQAANVYWTAGSAVTLGTNSIMKGTLIAGTSISILTGADLEGRALNQGPAAEAITLDACTITVPAS